MKIASPAFEHNSIIPKKYTCEGANINPPLIFSDVPKAAKSLVLIMDDPDVPLAIRPDGVWDHWLVWNIRPDCRAIAENSAPPGIVGLNTRGAIGYGGPCPPDKEHRYFFKLYALDTKLELSTDCTKSDLLAAMTNHLLASAELIGRYNKIINQ